MRHRARELLPREARPSFRGGSAVQFEQTAAHAQDNCLRVRYVITEQVGSTWIDGLLAQAIAFYAVHGGDNPITKIYFVVINSRTREYMSSFVPK